jgi:hypothetical protein
LTTQRLTKAGRGQKSVVFAIFDVFQGFPGTAGGFSGSNKSFIGAAGRFNRTAGGASRVVAGRFHAVGGFERDGPSHSPRQIVSRPVASSASASR